MRQSEREARKQRGIPYDTFVAKWVTAGPAEDIPYFGSWDDLTKVIATPPGAERYVMDANKITGVMMSNPKDRKIKNLQAENTALKAKLAALGG